MPDASPKNMTVSTNDRGVVQSMKIATTLLRDILDKFYGIENPCVGWETTPGSLQPVFWISFKNTFENDVYFKEFIDHWLNVKSDYNQGTDRENKLLYFDLLENVPKLLQKFLTENNFMQEPKHLQLSSDTPKVNILSKMSDSEFLSLKSSFYTSVQDCLNDALQSKHIPAARLTYNCDQLDQSLKIALYKAEQKKDYNIDEVFHIH